VKRDDLIRGIVKAMKDAGRDTGQMEKFLAVASPEQIQEIYTYWTEPKHVL
jgi:hypothetical protein